MLTLGIETSVAAGSVAVCRDGRRLGESRLERAGRRHAQTLAAEAETLLGRLQLAPGDFDAVAVSVGPGSFTGLRVGVVFAKTFAWATGCRLVGVETLRCVAENSPAEVTELFVIADAHRGELYAGRYVRGPDGTFARAGEIEIVPAEAWCRARGPADVVSGPGVECVEAEISGRCRVLEGERRLPQAGTVALLGESRAVAGDVDDVWSLEPLYLRKSAAEEKWEAGLRQEDTKARQTCVARPAGQN